MHKVEKIAAGGRRFKTVNGKESYAGAGFLSLRHTLLSKPLLENVSKVEPKSAISKQNQSDKFHKMFDLSRQYYTFKFWKMF